MDSDRDLDRQVRAVFEQELGKMVRAAQALGYHGPKLELRAGPHGYEVAFQWSEGGDPQELSSGWLTRADVRANRLDPFRNHLKFFALRIRARRARETNALPARP